MLSPRREFLRRITASAVVTKCLTSVAAAAPTAIRAIAFDAFPIFDPRPVFTLVNELYPDKGAELSNMWRQRQFEYTWLRTTSGQYEDFWQVTSDALVFAARALRLELTEDKKNRLMEAYLALKCWPDVPEALRTMKNSGIRLAFLSNMTGKMLEAGIRNSQLEGLFDHILSTDRVNVFKPHPRAYQMGLDALRLRRGEILFAAFAGWDAAGAKAFGYPTFWMNRQHQPAEELGAPPDATGTEMKDLVAFVSSRSLPPGKS